jgi:high-affinity iron transporter
MLGALIIVFREVIEAGLIVGIVLAVTKGIAGSRLLVGLGVVAGLIGASLVAAFAGAIGEALEGIGQEIFNASILIIAVVMLTWHNVWMARHGRELAAEVREVGDAVRTGSRSISALGVVVAIAVMREGSEVALSCMVSPPPRIRADGNCLSARCWVWRWVAASPPSPI